MNYVLKWLSYLSNGHLTTHPKKVSQFDAKYLIGLYYRMFSFSIGTNYSSSAEMNFADKFEGP